MKMDEKEYLWYKLCVFYHAKTEIFDRGLTVLRSMYDPSEAFVVGEARSYSNRYALSMRQFITFISMQLGLPNYKLNHFNNYHFSAQGWIDEYYRLKNIGEMDFINKFYSI